MDTDSETAIQRRVVGSHAHGPGDDVSGLRPSVCIGVHLWFNGMVPLWRGVPGGRGVARELRPANRILGTAAGA